MSCERLKSFGLQNVETDIENEKAVNNVNANKWKMAWADKRMIILNMIAFFP